MEDKNLYFDIILKHYESVWGSDVKTYLWDKGPIEKLPYDFRVLEFPPNTKNSLWKYATCCMSNFKDKDAIELHIFSKIRDTTIIELLVSLTYYHRNTKPLNLNHTVNFGRPWQNNSICNYGIISLPYIDGPDIENLINPNNNKIIKFYWLIPISKEELEYKIEFGISALENKFDEGFDYSNPDRKSLM